MEALEQLIEDYNLGDDFGSELKKLRDRLKSDLEPEDNISEPQASELKKTIEQYRKVVYDKISNKVRIPVSKKAFFAAEKAAQKPGELFEDEVWNWLSETPRNDIKEACRSLAVDCPTASTVMSLRAVEHCIREWHEQETGNKLDNPGWKTILDRLQAQYEEGSPESMMLSMLDYQRDKRNRVGHPDAHPDWRDARYVLNLVQGTISEIYDHVENEELDGDGEESLAEDIVDEVSDEIDKEKNQ